MNSSFTRAWSLVLLTVLFGFVTIPGHVLSLSLSSFSSFHGAAVQQQQQQQRESSSGIASLEMRKQKASDRRTRRLQRGDFEYAQELARSNADTVTQSPMSGKAWSHKQPTQQQYGNMQQPNNNNNNKSKTAGRSRGRKRSALYNSLSLYHNKFLNLLTEEYRQEEEEVMGRIKASIDDPLGYEAAGYAVFDLFPERRGNLYQDEVYRISKAKDATTFLEEDNDEDSTSQKSHILPPNHKFSQNDCIMLTLQPGGSGDFFGVASLPTTGISIEARVLNTGPTYIDVAVSSGSFEEAFGPAPNNMGPSGKGDGRMRLRADKFFSPVPYARMSAAVAQLTAIPDRQKQLQQLAQNETDAKNTGVARITMDDALREAIISTHAYSDPFSAYHNDKDFCDIRMLSNALSKPPMATSHQLAKKTMSYIRSDQTQIFDSFNEPQLGAIQAALTRRLTMIQGPPGTGKTSVASAIGLGFALQCRSISPHTKVLASAASNIGADNLAERFLKLGLNVVRIGRPSAVSEPLWEHTLDAYIDRDPNAQAALKNAARATAALQSSKRSKNGGANSKSSSSSNFGNDVSRELATNAVKASIKACSIAATKALREADIIVATNTGSSDPRLLAACGISIESDEEKVDASGRVRSGESGPKRVETDRNPLAPDGKPVLSMPFVIIDEACQAVEPSTLVPVTSTDSCRSLVLIGDPCQLPPTVKGSEDSPLSVSLMARLAAVLPPPNVPKPKITADFDTSYINSLPTKQARSLMFSIGPSQQTSYRKLYSGSFLLSTQYRMHSSIAAFPSAIFYDGLLATPSFLSRARPFPQALADLLPCSDKELGVRMIDVPGRNNENLGPQKGYSKAVIGSKQSIFTEESTSYWNRKEAVEVVTLLKKAVSAGAEGPQSIGVVTPYRGQVQLIKEMIGQDDELTSKLKDVSLEVSTVDGFQGREKDLIVFSAVRSNRSGHIGFLTDWRRLNVALTRAKAGLIVVGDIETLEEGDRHWAALAKWCKEVQCINRTI